MSELVIYGFETSNNFKVRIALGFKGIGHRFETIDPSDRTALVEMSGQPFTPILVHGDTTLFDSAAILRYLEANFRDTPKLFSSDYGTMRSIEEWEGFCRIELHEPLLIMVRQFISGVSDEAETARAAQVFADTTAKLEARLADNEWLAHSRMTAADVTGAAVIRRARAMDAFELPDRPATHAWAEKVNAFDPGPGS